MDPAVARGSPDQAPNGPSQPGPLAPLPDATVVDDDGRIACVGAGCVVPASATVVDGARARRRARRIGSAGRTAEPTGAAPERCPPPGDRRLHPAYPLQNQRRSLCSAMSDVHPPPTPTSADPQTPPTHPPRRPGTILGRLAQAVREQNWFAVALELVIVVLGVVIGFQVNAWGAAQADARLGQAYTERLLADLDRHRAYRRDILTYYEAVTASAERTVDLLTDPEAGDRDLVVHAYRATEYVYIPPIRATWDEVVSSGHVGLLPGRAGEAVSDVFSYDTAFDVLAELKDSPYRLRVRSVLPHAVQSAIRERCGDLRDETGTIVGFQSDCDLRLGDDVLAAAADALRSAPEITEGLRYQFSDLASARANVRGEVVFVDRALAALNGRDATATP